MKEIEELFKTTKVNDIKKLLKAVIQKIETVDKKEQEVLLKEVVKNVKETEKILLDKYTVIKGFTFFPESIAPLALLVEELSNDIDNNEDILKILKFNLNNYFAQFKEAKESDWHVETDELQHVIWALSLECDYFKILEKHDMHLSIMMFNNRFRKCNMEVLNYSSLKNKNFAIHSFYCEQYANNKKTVSECTEPKKLDIF